MQLDSVTALNGSAHQAPASLARTAGVGLDFLSLLESLFAGMPQPGINPSELRTPLPAGFSAQAGGEDVKRGSGGKTGVPESLAGLLLAMYGAGIAPTAEQPPEALSQAGADTVVLQADTVAMPAVVLMPTRADGAAAKGVPVLSEEGEMPAGFTDSPGIAPALRQPPEALTQAGADTGARQTDARVMPAAALLSPQVDGTAAKGAPALPEEGRASAETLLSVQSGLSQTGPPAVEADKVHPGAPSDDKAGRPAGFGTALHIQRPADKEAQQQPVPDAVQSPQSIGPQPGEQTGTRSFAAERILEKAPLGNRTGAVPAAAKAEPGTAVSAVKGPRKAADGTGKDDKKDGSIIQGGGLASPQAADIRPEHGTRPDGGTPEVARQLSQAVKTAADQGRSEIRLHLSPEDLGGIHIRIVSQAGVLHLKITAENGKTGEMLAAGLGDLNRTLQQNGLNVAKAEVSYAPAGGESFNLSQNASGRQSYQERRTPVWIPAAPYVAPIQKVDIIPAGRMSIFA